MNRSVMVFQFMISCFYISVAMSQKISDGDTKTKTVTLQFHKGRSAYIITSPKTELQKRIAQRLADYLSNVLGKQAKVVTGIEAVPAGEPIVILSSTFTKNLIGKSGSSFSPEAFTLDTRNLNGHAVIMAAGNTELGLKRAVQKLILKSEQAAPGLVIPDIHISECPWIPEREWALCPWDPAFARGVFHNPNADKRLNVWLYSDNQIEKYVEMYDWFGFSGCQLLEGCTSYSDRGSPEAFQSLLKKFAGAIRENGQTVSYWIWAAQFNDYGWVDPEVVYVPQKGLTAFEDPKVRATFEKYYNHYAEMAPYVDRLIAHFYDPGMLKDRKDVFKYLGLLRDKFTAKNPSIKLAVDMWGVAEGGDATAQYMQQLRDNGFGNALLLETSMPHYWPAGKREALHEEAKKHNINMGIWGWYTTEMETDQAPMMSVNAKLLSRFYRQIKSGVDKIAPVTYWSEMEAYHLNNIFTMYASGQLLWNPDRDPDEILREIAEGIWGPLNGPQVLQAIKLIEDTRTGPSWDTYWWSLPGRRLGTENAGDDLRRAEEAITALEKMKTDPGFVPKFPLPFPPATFVELTLPHLRQIKEYADFRIKVQEIKEAAKNGATKDELTRLVKISWKPIPEYNTWVGVFGQWEAIKQEETVTQLSKDLGISIITPGWLRFQDADRLLQAIQNRQRYIATPWKFPSDKGWLLSSAAFMLWSGEKFRDRLKLLIDSGVVEKVGDYYQLTNWENYKLQ